MSLDEEEPDSVVSIHQRRDSGAWEVTVCLPKQPIVRRSDKRWSRFDAQRVELELLAGNTAHTLDDALDKWRDDYALHLKSRKTSLDHLLKLREHTAGLALSQAPAVATVLKRMVQQLKPATIDRRLAILRRVCRLAYEDWDWLDKPVHHKIKLLHVANARHYYLTRAQVEGLAFACRNRDAGDLIVFAVFTGLRRGEMMRVTSSDVHGDTLRLGINTKTGRPRSIPLHPRALNIALRMPLAVTSKQLQLAWNQARATMHLEHIHWHDLRHTTASWLIQTGATLVEVMDILGHVDIESTLRYAHLAPENLRTAIGRL